MNLSIKEAAEKIRAGGLVAFPTETVYGLGANALDCAAVQKIYELKGRPAASPLIVHVASIEMAREIVAEWPPLAEELARKWWPGPLTLVLPKQPVDSGHRHRWTADRGSAHAEPSDGAGVDSRGGRADCSAQRESFHGAFAHHRRTRAAGVRRLPSTVLDGGPAQVGIESTVVAIENGELKLLRPGMISLGELEAVVETTGSHQAPGMHPRHYSPHTRLLLVGHPGELPDRSGAYVWRKKSGLAACSIRMPEHPAEYAARLYAVLHKLDQEGWPWIAVEAPPDTAAWAAIRDRLRRAAEALP